MDRMAVLDALGYIFRSACSRDVGNLCATHTSLDSGHFVGDSTRFCRGGIDPNSHSQVFKTTIWKVLRKGLTLREQVSWILRDLVSVLEVGEITEGSRSDLRRMEKPV